MIPKSLKMLFGKGKKLRKLEEESFQARIQMEQNAQLEITARLEVAELIFKNQGRIH